MLQGQLQPWQRFPALGGQAVLGAGISPGNVSVVVCDVKVFRLVTLGVALLPGGIKSFLLPAAGAGMGFFFFPSMRKTSVKSLGGCCSLLLTFGVFPKKILMHL